MAKGGSNEVVLEAVSYIHRLGKGSSRPRPHLFTCNDGQKYAVRLMIDNKSIRPLVNEFVAYRLAERLDLPVPKTSIVHVSDNLIQNSSRFPKNIVPGNHFGSFYYIDTILPTKKSIFRCRNVDKIADMLLFDIWINNRDRNLTNILVRKKKQDYQLILIDHDKVFNHRDWKGENLIKNMSENKLEYRWGRNQKYFRNFINSKAAVKKSLRRIEALPKSEIAFIVNAIPKEWCVSSKERNTLVRFLELRKFRLGKVVNRF
ncbi:HipA family kinase [Salipaludibacillus sp. HK11]|uniref:HipA family kinase n=1 Tax=Salipaludibacillus sp. HK11 TaxID=3394320 RepID=UPI0039FBBD11